MQSSQRHQRPPRTAQQQRDNTQLLQMSTDMWYVTYIHKLKYDEIPKRFRGLTVKKEGRNLVLAGYKSHEARKFILNFFRDHYMKVVRYDLFSKIHQNNRDFMNLKATYYFEVIESQDFLRKLEEVKSEFGDEPVNYILDKILYKKRNGFTVIYSLKKDSDIVEKRIEFICSGGVGEMPQEVGRTEGNNRNNNNNNYNNSNNSNNNRNFGQGDNNNNRREGREQRETRQTRQTRETREIKGTKETRETREIQQRQQRGEQRGVPRTRGPRQTRGNGRQQIQQRDQQEQRNQRPPRQQKNQTRENQQRQQTRNFRKNKQFNDDQRSERGVQRGGQRGRQEGGQRTEQRSDKRTRGPRQTRGNGRQQRQQRNQQDQKNQGPPRQREQAKGDRLNTTQRFQTESNRQSQRPQQQRRPDDFKKRTGPYRVQRQQRRKDERPIDRNQQLSLDFTEKQLFLTFYLTETKNIIQSDEFIAYMQMDNLYIRALPHVCQRINDQLRKEIKKWNLLVFYLKYSVDLPEIRSSLSPQAKLKIITSDEMEKESNRIRTDYQTDKFNKIIKNYKQKGDYLIFIFLKQYNEELQGILFNQIGEKLQKQHEQELDNLKNNEMGSNLNSIYKIRPEDFDEDDFLNFSRNENIDESEIEISTGENDIVITSAANMSNFTKQNLDRYFNHIKYIYLNQEEEKMGLEFIKEMNKKYPRLTMSLEHLYSSATFEEIQHDVKIEQQIERQIFNNDTKQTEDRPIKIQYIALAGLNNLCNTAFQEFANKRVQEMQKKNIISTVWKITIPELIKYNLAKQNVRTLIENYIRKNIEMISAKDIKIQRKKPERDYNFNIQYNKDKLDIGNYQRSFENLIEKNIEYYKVLEFKSISEMYNIEGVDKVGVFVEDDGEVSMISFDSFSDHSVDNLELLIKKEKQHEKLTMNQGNYYFMISQSLRQAQKEGIIVEERQQDNKKVVILKGYKFRIKRLKGIIDKIIAEAKKSLDFDLMYINTLDKEVLENNNILEPMKKQLDITIQIERSKSRIYHIDFQNYNRFTVTTCEIDKYPVALRVTHQLQDLNLDEVKKKVVSNCYFYPDSGLLFMNPAFYQNKITEYFKSLFLELAKHKLEAMDIKLTLPPQFPLRDFMKCMIVYLDENSNKEQIHLCIDKNTLKSWEDIHRQLKDNTFKNSKEKTLVQWKYKYQNQWKLIKPDISEKIQQKHCETRVSYSEGKVELTQKDIPIFQEYRIIKETKTLEVPQQSSFWDVFRTKQVVTRNIQQKYLVNVANNKRYKIINDSYLMLPTNQQKALPVSVRNLISMHINTNIVHKIGLLKLRVKQNFIQNELTGELCQIKRQQRVIEEEIKINYILKQFQHLHQITFQCDKSKYAFIMGAKHQIKQKLKQAKRCEYKIMIKSEDSFGSNHYSYGSYSTTKLNYGYNIHRIKKVVEDNLGILDFPKKSNFRGQTEVTALSFSSEQNEEMRKQLQQTSTIFSYVQLNSRQTILIRRNFPGITITSIQKVNNPELETLYNNNKYRYLSFGAVEQELYYGSRDRDLEEICTNKNVSFDVAQNSSDGVITFYKTSSGCISKFRGLGNQNKILVCKVMTGVQGGERKNYNEGEIAIIKSNLALPVYLIQYL